MKIGTNARSVEITPRGILIIAVLVIGAPGATVYRDSLLEFLSRLAAIVGSNAKMIPTLFYF